MLEYFAIRGFLAGFTYGVVTATLFWIAASWATRRFRPKPRTAISHFPSTR